MPAPLIHLQVYSAHVAFEACVNDIPIVSLPEPLEAFDQQIPVNQYVVPKYNRVDLWVGIAGKPSECRVEGRGAAPKGARVAARLVRYASGRVEPDQEEKLAEVQWDPSRDPAGTKYPQNVGLSVDMGAGFGSWSWQSAAPLVMSDALREETRVLLEALRHAIRTGDSKTVLDMLRVNFDEVGKAYGAVDDAKDLASLEGFVARYAAEPERVLPLDPKRFDLRLVGGDRMVETLDEDWQTSLRFRQAVLDQDGAPAGEMIIPYSLLLARVGEGLKIVR